MVIFLSKIESKISDEEDPTVPDWAKSLSKPDYVASEIDVPFATADGSMDVSSVLRYILSKIGEAVTENPYRDVTWNTTANFTLGDNDSAEYNGWCANNLQFDKTRNQFYFLQNRCNSHVSNAKWYTPKLYCVDPAQPTEYTELECPVTETQLCSFLITDDGAWYIWSANTRYLSTDGGNTWESVAINLPIRFGVWKIGDTLYSGDDSSNVGVYRTSVDMGITWEEHNFGVNGSYTDCEASFCEFKGVIYAFLRTNTTDFAVVLKYNGESWDLVCDDKLLAYASTCSPVAFGDKVAIAHFSRKNMHLYYTEWDGENTWITYDVGAVYNQSRPGDCHTPTLAFGNGYAAISMFVHAFNKINNAEYWTAQNAWYIGAYDDNKATMFLSDSTDFGGNFGQLTSYTPEDAEYFEGNGFACNPNDVPVVKWNPNEPYVGEKYGLTQGYNAGSMILTRNGHLIGYKHGYSSLGLHGNLRSFTNAYPHSLMSINGLWYIACGASLQRVQLEELSEVITQDDIDVTTVLPNLGDKLWRVGYYSANGHAWFSQAVKEQHITDGVIVLDHAKPNILLDNSTIMLDAAANATLTAVTKNTSDAVTWSTSDSEIATVSDGVITPVANGTCYIIASVGIAVAFCVVKVSGFINATSVILDQTALSFADNTPVTLTATVQPENTTDTLTWSTSNSAVATVSDGVVTPVADGTCTITAKCGSVSATCSVTVALAEADS